MLYLNEQLCIMYVSIDYFYFKKIHRGKHILFVRMIYNDFSVFE